MIGTVVTAKIILDNSTFHTFLFNWPVGSLHGKVVRKISTSNQQTFCKWHQYETQHCFPRNYPYPPPTSMTVLFGLNPSMLPPPPPPPPKKKNPIQLDTLLLNFWLWRSLTPLEFPMTFHWVGMDFFLKLHNKQNVYLSNSVVCLV